MEKLRRETGLLDGGECVFTSPAVITKMGQIWSGSREGLRLRRT